MTVQGNTRCLLRTSLTIGWRRVKIIHAMLNGIVHFPVHHLLINVSIGMITFRTAADHGKAHHTIT